MEAGLYPTSGAHVEQLAADLREELSHAQDFAEDTPEKVGQGTATLLQEPYFLK